MATRTGISRTTNSRTSGCEAYVGLDSNDKMFVRSQTGLRVPLMDRLNATAQYNIDWDNNPTDGRERTDKTVLLTLGYTW